MEAGAVQEGTGAGEFRESISSERVEGADTRGAARRGDREYDLGKSQRVDVKQKKK